MWIPSKLVSWFDATVNTANDLREELAATKAELAATQKDLVSTKVNLDWLRVQYNQVQLERAALMEKVYGIRTNVPQLQVSVPQATLPNLEDFSFEDMGDDKARELGFPTFN